MASNYYPDSTLLSGYLDNIDVCFSPNADNLLLLVEVIFFPVMEKKVFKELVSFKEIDRCVGWLTCVVTKLSAAIQNLKGSLQNFYSPRLILWPSQIVWVVNMNFK